MNYYKHPQAYSNLRQLYWKLRHIRAFDLAGRRRYYRHIKVERLYLVEQGASAEHVRLYCRYMADLNRPERIASLIAYEKAVLDYSRFEARLRLTGACSLISNLEAPQLEGSTAR